MAKSILLKNMQIKSQRITFSEEDRKEICQLIDRSLTTGQVAQGENVKSFEDNFAQFVGTKHAVAVNSGGAAIGIGMRLLGVKNKTVLVPSNTFVATATEVLLAGGGITFVDAEPKTFSVSLASLQAALTPETVGVIIVHIGGIITPEIEAIRDWCKEQELWLFEDAAHAHGSSFNGKQAGQFGCMTAYSFFATKVMTSGEGGMLVTDDDELAQRARCLRDYGKPQPWVSYYTEIGSNWRMSEFCAAIGIVQLRPLQEFVSWREKVANLYTSQLSGLSQITLVLALGKSSWYKYILLLPPQMDREQVKQAMKAQGVSLPGGVYEIPLHRQPIFADTAGEFPTADDICNRHICLPIYFGLTAEEVKYTIDTFEYLVRDFQKLYGVPFTILRYGIPYGPGMWSGLVLRNFLDRAFAKEALTIFGDGSASRRFVFVDDLAKAHVLALQDIATNQAYNLEGMRFVTIKELAELVTKLLGGDDIVYKEEADRVSELNYSRKLVSSHKAYIDFGWEPKVDLEEGVRRTIDWYRQEIISTKADDLARGDLYQTGEAHLVSKN